jgi:hypothetical protein
MDVIILKCALKPASTVTSLVRGSCSAASSDTYLGVSAVVPADSKCQSEHHMKTSWQKGRPSPRGALGKSKIVSGRVILEEFVRGVGEVNGEVVRYRLLIVNVYFRNC